MYLYAFIVTPIFPICQVKSFQTPICRAVHYINNLNKTCQWVGKCHGENIANPLGWQGEPGAGAPCPLKPSSID